MLGNEFLSRFTGHLREALQHALAFAIGSGRDAVDPGDLLVGLLQQQGSIAAEILSKSSVDVKKAEEAFRGFPKPHESGGAIAPDLSPAVRRALEKCVLMAHVHEHRYVGTEHLLLALLESSLPDVHTFLESQGMNLDLAKEQLAHILRNTSRFPDMLPREEAGVLPPQEGNPEVAPPSPAMPGNANQPQHGRVTRDKRPRAVEVFARELTAPETVSKLDPVIGRDAETDRVIEILCRRSKNNPILLGEPGVGKTAIVEGLAQRLAAGDVPDVLQGKRIYAIDLALMVAGTMYRGEFEARLKQLVEEVRLDPTAILFIDEIHNLVGAGSTSGSLDAANILKPALARGEIRCIGATTWNEFKKHLEPDAALERRFQPIDVPEPTAELAGQMLQGLKTRYEEHHNVRYAPDALEAAIRLSERYLTDRFFPDKAIDVLDEAAAYVNARRRSRESVERLRALEIALDAMRETKEAAVDGGSLPEASSALEDEERLIAEKKRIEESMIEARKQDRLPVTVDHIARIVSRLARVPYESVIRAEREQLRGLEGNLAKRIFGQAHVVREVAETVRKARLGLSDPKRPRASFLFVGPSGTGKTELAKALAHELFGREDALVKLDMSEFAEGHSVSKLLGSPAGYVGFREGNRLADTIRKHPHAVLLFDEFEKAHPDVQHLLLQALEDGRITDGSGRHIPFRHAYIILTSNVGAEYLKSSALGFGESTDGFDSLVRAQLKERFRPELLNRLDRIIVFKPLESETLRDIVRRELDVVLGRVKEAQDVALSAGDDVLDWLMKRDFPSEEGARSARRVVEREIMSLLSEMLVEQPNKKKGTLKVTKDRIKVA
ncbi:ATP-dependent Clp protease ATP-binding subunit [Candidatus Uhrbacteria bacterium]|nr:ATP-dependent Clp protease ATP-binding subunit [Candidatus Uhrbacteria bacterium]